MVVAVGRVSWLKIGSNVITSADVFFCFVKCSLQTGCPPLGANVIGDVEDNLIEPRVAKRIEKMDGKLLSANRTFSLNHGLFVPREVYVHILVGSFSHVGEGFLVA